MNKEFNTTGEFFFRYSCFPYSIFGHVDSIFRAPYTAEELRIRVMRL
jgi:hypothetical protein